MIYCKLKKVEENSAIYYFSSGCGEKGEIRFFKDKSSPEIIMEPEIHVTRLWIGKLLLKYAGRFSEGIFPERISYEC